MKKYSDVDFSDERLNSAEQIYAKSICIQIHHKGGVVMGTPANIIINFDQESFLLDHKPDQMFLFAGYDGYPFKLAGMMYLIARAYSNMDELESKHPNLLSVSTSKPEYLACEMIRLSYNEERKYYKLMPASRQSLEQFEKCGYFQDCAFRYDINFRKEANEGNVVDVAISSASYSTEKGIDDWRKVVSTAFEYAIYSDRDCLFKANDCAFCDMCIVKATCIVTNGRRNYSIATKPCDKMRNYRVEKLNKLTKEIPEWAMPLIVDNDF